MAFQDELDSVYRNMSIRTEKTVRRAPTSYHRGGGGAGFAEQMRELYDIEERLKRNLAIIQQEIDICARLDWEEKVNDDVADLQARIAELNNTIPKTLEEQHHVFLMKRRLVDELVVEAMIDSERDIQVDFRAKIMDLAVSKQILAFPNDNEIVVRL